MQNGRRTVPVVGAAATATVRPSPGRLLTGSAPPCLASHQINVVSVTLPGHRSAGHATCSGRQARGRAPLTGGRGRRPRSTILCRLLREPGGPPRPQTCPHQMHWLPSELNKILCKPTTCKLKTKSSVTAVDRDTHPLESCRRARSPELWRGVSDAGKSGLMWSDCPTSRRQLS